MTALSIQSPFPIITDIDGQPLEDGYIWIGVANLPPIGNPIAVYWDAALTQPAALPVRTRGGYPVNAGTPARLYVGSDYSIQVQNKNGSVIYSAPDGASDRFSAAQIEFLQAGVGAVVRTVQSKMRDVVSVKDFGAVGDGVADDTAAFQNAVSTGKLVYLPQGAYKTSAPIVFNQNTAGMVGDNYQYSLPNGSVIDYTGPDEAIRVSGSGGVRQVTGLTMERFGIAVRSASAKGLNFRDASYSRFKDIWVRLYASNSTGVYGIGNEQPGPSFSNSAPYYNVFDNVQVFGQTDGITTVGQRGYWFVGDGVGASADGPNANIITNIGRLSGLEVAFDIYSGNGNMFSNISMEAIRSYCFKIGNGVGAPGRAVGNVFTNMRVEDQSSCVFARFEGQAESNKFTNYSTGGLDSVLFENSAYNPATQGGYSNICTPLGQVIVLNFYTKNVPASSTIKLDPEWTGNEGGIRVPMNAVPYAMFVTVNRFGNGGLGSGVINFYRSDILNPNLTFTVDNANRFGGVSVQTAPDIAFGYNQFSVANGAAAQVQIVTDGAWDQTTADVHVQMVFLA
jgi:hypothetical protein